MYFIREWNENDQALRHQHIVRRSFLIREIQPATKLTLNAAEPELQIYRLHFYQDNITLHILNSEVPTHLSFQQVRVTKNFRIIKDDVRYLQPKTFSQPDRAVNGNYF